MIVVIKMRKRRKKIKIQKRCFLRAFLEIYVLKIISDVISLGIENKS